MAYSDEEKDRGLFVSDDNVKWIDTPKNRKKWKDAINQCDIITIKKYLEEGAPYTTTYKYTPSTSALELSAFCGRVDVIKLIIDKHKNSDLNLEKENEYKKQASEALKGACKSNDRAIAKLLLNEGIKGEEIHIQEAAKNGSWAVIDQILKKSTNAEKQINAPNEDGNTPLHIAAEKGFTPTARYLLENRGNPNKKNNKGQSILHLACKSSNHSLVQLLLEYNADVNELDNNGKQPIHYAANYGHETIIQLLANGKSDLDVRDRSGNVPLTIAAINGHTTVMRELILNGASIEVVDYKRFNALEIALQHNFDFTAATYIRLEPTEDYVGTYIETIEISMLKVVENKLTQSTVALLDRMVVPFEENIENKDNVHPNKAIAKTLYLEVDKDKFTPVERLVDLDDGKVYNRDKQYFLQTINDLGNQDLAYHGIIRLLVDEKMRKYGYFMLLFKAFFFALFIIALAYSLVVAARENSPINRYLTSTASIIQILCEIYVFCYWFVNIGTEIIEVISVFKLSRKQLKDEFEEIKDDKRRENKFLNSGPTDGEIAPDDDSLRSISISKQEDPEIRQKNSEVRADEDSAKLISNSGVEESEISKHDHETTPVIIFKNNFQLIDKLNKLQLITRLQNCLVGRVLIDYFEDKSNYFDLAGLVSLFILILLRVSDQPSQWVFAAFTLLVNFVRLFKFITLIPELGPYAIIIFQILIRDVPKFAAMFLLTLIIYSCCFFVALRTPYSGIGFRNSSFDNTVRIVGVDDEIWWVFLSGIRVLLEGSFIEMNYLHDRYNWLAATIYLVFLFLIVVVYLNVFIAQLSDTYADTKEKANIYNAWFRLNFIIQMERTSLLSFFIDVRKKTMIKEIEIDKSKFQEYFGVSSYPAFRAKTISEVYKVGEREEISRKALDITLNSLDRISIRLTKLEYFTNNSCPINFSEV